MSRHLLYSYLFSSFRQNNSLENTPLSDEVPANWGRTVATKTVDLGDAGGGDNTCDNLLLIFAPAYSHSIDLCHPRQLLRSVDIASSDTPPIGTIWFFPHDANVPS